MKKLNKDTEKKIIELANSSIISNLIIKKPEYFGLNRLKNNKKQNEAMIKIAIECAKNLFNSYRSNYFNYKISDYIEKD